MNQFTTTYEYDDCVHANRRFLLNSFSYRWTIPFLLLVVIAIVAINYHPCCLIRMDAFISAFATTAIYLLCTIVLLLIYFFWSLPHSVRQKWDSDHREGQTATYVIDPQGFEVTSPHLNRRCEWSDMHWWSEDRRLILMKYAAIGMIWIPKRQVSLDTLALIRTGLIDAAVRKV